MYEIYQNLKLVEKICAQQNAQNLKLRYERELAKCKDVLRNLKVHFSQYEYVGKLERAANHPAPKVLIIQVYQKRKSLKSSNFSSNQNLHDFD